MTFQLDGNAYIIITIIMIMIIITGVPSLPDFPGVSQKQISISRLLELEQDLPEVLYPQLFHVEIT